MSATTRQKTRVLVVVHSHIDAGDGSKGVIDCSLDTIAVNTSKTIKGTGGFSFVLVPRKNYLNLIFPDDVVNIYIDPGDGKRGFVRTMMGYIDRIERVEVVKDNGEMSTHFRVVGTDFAKAIDKTEVYFNPNLANRSEFTNSSFGLSQLGGGHALRTRGIVAHGTPAQFVENMLQLLLGFGTQWVLPRSYSNQNFFSKVRSQRRQRAKARLPKTVKTALQDAFGTDIEQIGLDQDIETQLLQKQEKLATDVKLAEQGGFPDDTVDGFFARQETLSDLLAASVELTAYQNMLRESQAQSAASILDVLSLDFIEALTIDGYISSSSVWTNQGTLASLLYGWSNEIVNELCFDLRPVTTDSADQCFGTQYSKESDELGYNVRGTNAMPASVHAVQYTPAVVFREYPYSTVEGLDLSKYYVMGSPAGFQAFGPIFSKEPNVAGRKLYNYQNAGIDALTPEKCYYDDAGAPLKHLDVVVIKNSDVTGSQIGRSDNDIFNLFELYAQDPTARLWKFLLNEILPVLTPVSIARHGLRLRQLNTKFANYARDQLCSGSSGIDEGAIRRNLVRWTLLIDHWYQHNVEYTNGTINLRGMPEIRVGYRLDWQDRHESYYVEGVTNEWQYPDALRTNVQVSRGQRNDPMPAYVPPILSRIAGQANLPGAQQVTAAPGLAGNVTSALLQQLANQRASSVSKKGGGDRSEKGRLAQFFRIKDTAATALSVGGEARYSGQNDIDDPSNLLNVPGAMEFPGLSANRDDKPVADQIGDMAISDFGKDTSK